MIIPITGDDSRSPLDNEKTEQALAFQAFLLDNVHDAVIGVDADSLITYLNRSAEALYGWTTAEAIGLNILGLLTPDVDGEEWQAICRSLQHQERYDRQSIHRAKDGRQVFVEETWMQFKDHAGRIQGYACTVRDVTERKRAEETRLRSEAILAQAGQMAHLGAWEIHFSNYRVVLQF